MKVGRTRGNARWIGYALAVVQHIPTGYVFDLNDPRAPTHEQWEQMSPVERARAIALLPSGDSTSEALVRRVIGGSSEWRVLPDDVPIEM